VRASKGQSAQGLRVIRPLRRDRAFALKLNNQTPEQKSETKAAPERSPTKRSIVLVFPNRPCFAEASAWVKERCAEDHAYRAKYEEAVAHVQSVRTLSLLRLRYPSEYKAHDNEKHRAKTLDPRLADFRDWLVHMGPRPESGWSVDRINPKKGYLVGNMRWATAQTQTDNQRVKRWHLLPDGRKFTTSQLAQHLGVRYDTLYQALRRGTPLDALLERHGFHADAEHAWRFPTEVASDMELRFKKDRKLGQSRLQWYCKHLQKTIEHLEQKNFPRQDLAPMKSEFERVSDELKSIRQAKSDRMDHAALALLKALSPPPPAVHLPPLPPPKADRPATLEEIIAISASLGLE
jgi:hypothetical protein